jgi:hypothetical protein
MSTTSICGAAGLLRVSDSHPGVKLKLTCPPMTWVRHRRARFRGILFRVTTVFEPGSTLEYRKLQQRRSRAARSRLGKEGPGGGALQCTKALGGRQSSGGDRQQVPVLGQNDRIDGVNDAIRGDEILRDVGSVDPHVRGRYSDRQRGALQRHLFARLHI